MNTRGLRIIATLAGFAIALCCTPRQASAQALADEVYSDAKDVITELIERDVAESIAPNLACYSQGGLLKYFPKTLQAVYERNFGAMKDVLQHETVDMMGNYAFESFRQHRSIPLREFLPIASFTPSNSDACADHIRDLGGPAAYQAELAEKARRTNGGFYLPLDRCDTASGPPAALEVSCYVAQGAIAATNGDGSNAADLLSDALGGTTALLLAQIMSPDTKPDKLQELPGYVGLRRLVVNELQARITLGAFPANGALATFASGDLGKVLDLAKLPLDQICESKSTSLRVRAGAWRMLFAPTEAVSVVKGKPTDRVVPLLPMLGDFNPNVANAPANEGPVVAIARAVLAHVARVPAGTVTATIENGAVVLDFDPSSKLPVAFTGPGLERLALLSDMARTSAQYEGLLQQLAPAKDLAISEAVVRGVVGLVQAGEQMWGNVHGLAKGTGEKFEPLTLLDGIARACSAPTTVPVVAGTPAMQLTPCAVWKQAIGLLDPQGVLRPILTAARQKDYRALAVAAVSAIFSDASTEEMCCGQDDISMCLNTTKLYGRLAKTVVSYVLMSRDDEDASIAARAAFKSAAVDVIRDLGKRGGVERKPSLSSFAASIVTPTGTLRASWSGSYQNEDSRHTGVRFVPTIDMLTFRFGLTHPESQVYFGAAVSLLDVLAPVAELVSRRADVTYEHQPLFLATFIQPRLSGVLAIPELSKHTVLTLGASMRGAAALRIDDKTYGYETVLNKVSYSDLDHFGQLFEVSAGVQYIP
jgi:hypothetical protein